MIRRIESLEDFRAWLRLQPPENVYVTNSGAYCPLAAYSECSVGYSFYRPPMGDSEELPRWASAFIAKITLMDGTRISAAEALAIAEKLTND